MQMRNRKLRAVVRRPGIAIAAGALRADQTSGDPSEIETSRLGRDVARLIALLSLIAILWLGGAGL